MVEKGPGNRFDDGADAAEGFVACDLRPLAKRSPPSRCPLLDAEPQFPRFVGIEADLVGPESASTILFADDEETIRSIGGKMLERAGFDVLLACDGREAVEVFKQHQDVISLVILDLTMPNLDGEACYCEIRRINPSVRVMLSSGYAEQEIAMRFAGKGLSGFVQKPYTARELREKVEQVLSDDPA